jgi:phospholipase C
MTGFRTPTVSISPYARRGEVSHAVATHDSILKLISYRFGLPYLNKRHRYASNIGRTFDWENPDFSVPTLPSPLPPLTTACAVQSAVPSTSPGAVRARRNQPMEFSSPEFHEYLRRQGYPVNRAKAEETFNDPKVVERMKQIWNQ